jgi:hypothetical protein
VADERLGPHVHRYDQSGVVAGDELVTVRREQRQDRPAGTPGSGAPTAWPVGMSPRRTLPVARVRPSGMIAAELIPLASPPSQRVTGFHVAVDHTCVLADAVADRHQYGISEGGYGRLCPEPTEPAE